MTAADKSPRKLPTTAPEAIQEAQDQAEAYESIFASTPLELDNGETMMIPLHPDYNMLGDDEMEAYEDLMFDLDTKYDREPDTFIPEQTVTSGDTTVTLPSDTRRGALKVPYRIRGERVKPAHSVKVVQVALGEVAFKQLKAGGKDAADVWKIWGAQSMKIRERQLRDSKSAGSPVALAPVSAPDS